MVDPRTIDGITQEIPDPITSENIVHNPSEKEITNTFEQEVWTEFGSPAFIGEHRSRSADKTKNNIDSDFDDEDFDHISDAISEISSQQMICIDRRVGDHPDHSYVCRYYVSKDYAHIALAWSKLTGPVKGKVDPDFLTIQLPECDHTKIRVLPDVGLTVVLGSDYIGEAKKSFLRLFMYHAKKKGGLGIHAGSKKVAALSDRNTINEVGQLFFGLSATGKSTLTAHDLGLKQPEKSEMIQDDVCAMLPNGAAVGSEISGLYVKTHQIDEASQPEMYKALTHKSAILENVHVNDKKVDFGSDFYTKNGRGTISRELLSSSSENINLDSVDQIFFITRNPIAPIATKLSPVEAAASFMLGESIQTSAGDPSQIGEPIRVVGTNPFIIGSKGKEGNRFLSLISENNIGCYTINTGYIGDKSVDISVEDSVTLIREIARGTVNWDSTDCENFTTPVSVPGMNVEQFEVANHVDSYQRKVEQLSTKRKEYLNQFVQLDEEIKKAP